jgi:hypothetical protein
MMDEFINVRSIVNEFLQQHPELKEHELLLLELTRDTWHHVGCSWPSCQDAR